MENFVLEASKRELRYRNELFKGDYSKILDTKIKCTVCSANISWMVLFKKQIMKHPLLEVMLCEACFEPHRNTDWIEVCLWCGLKKPEIMTCRDCTAQFCENCIQINYGLQGVLEAKLNNWKCFICERRGLEIFRAICYAAEKLTESFRKSDELALTNPATECSSCNLQFKQVKKLNCGHKFHFICFQHWVEKNQICPLCRAKVTDCI